MSDSAKKYLLASLALLATGAYADEPRTIPVAEARKIAATGAKYEVEGEVISSTRYWSAIQDDTGVMQVRNWTSPWELGDIVRMTVETVAPSNDSPGYVRRIARRSQVTGHRAPKPPQEVRSDDVSRGRIEPLSPVVLSGTVTSAIPDDIDGAWSFLIVESEGDQAIVSLRWPDASARRDMSHLIDAEVSVSGIFLRQGDGGRQFMGRNILIESTNSISVVQVAPVDPFASASPLKLDWPTDITAIADGHRRLAVGTVTASWMGRNFVLKTDNGHPITVKLPAGHALPKTGMRVEAAGFVRQTPFVMKLSNALWREVDGPAPMELPLHVEARQLFSDVYGNPVVNVRYHGHLVSFKGMVGEVFNLDSPTRILALNCDGNPIMAIAENMQLPPPGSVVEVTGICIANENSDSDDLIRLSGLTVVLRDQSDLKVLKHPPWWTVDRLLVVIGILFASIAVAAFWVAWLNKLVRRRSRELLKEQIARTESELRIGERTRLAVELHDSLSQSLAALSFQISSARSAKAAGMDEAERAHLSKAEKMLDASRTELRHCLFDLRSNTLEERNMETAILKTLKADTAEAEINIDFHVTRSRLNDTTAHATLMIIRELVSNAIRHGEAKHIRISGGIEGSCFSFLVTDDGTGFDVASRPGQNEGHFGLAGVHQRVSNLGGTFDLRSSPGKGTTATVTIQLTNHNKHQCP